MPGANCCIVGCGSCRRKTNDEESQKIGIFKLPTVQANKKWRDKWLAEIKRTRLVYICEKHFSPEDIEICEYM